jgi:hypothetical protein
VVNAASFVPGVAAGALETIVGANLSGGRVSLNGSEVPLLYGSDAQMNFYAPAETPVGHATLTVTGASGEQASRTVEVAAAQPGIFTATVNGDFVDVYCTGLHGAAAPVVFVGAVPVTPAAVEPVSPGVYRVQVGIPGGLAPGTQTVLLSVDLQHSNAVQITVP